MTAPADAAGRFLWACLLGAVLGLIYGFLRPMSRRRTILADGLFLAAAVWVWLYHSFAVCRGDIRLGCGAGLLGGGLAWELTLGRLLRPVFSGFWKLIGRLLAFIGHRLKKILDFAKILFASGEKWVTIKWNNRRQKRRRPGGNPHGRKN